MGKHQAKKLASIKLKDRQDRIQTLIEAGWIKDACEIPKDAIPSNPYALNQSGSWTRVTFFQSLQFHCLDCGAAQVWTAEQQRWYFEVVKAPIYHTAKRCRPCRIKERLRIQTAQKASSHPST